MTDLSIKVKVRDLKSAYEEGCDDVKRVLRKMYPEIFEEKWVDITTECIIERRKHLCVVHKPTDKLVGVITRLDLSASQYLGEFKEKTSEYGILDILMKVK